MSWSRRKRIGPPLADGARGVACVWSLPCARPRVVPQTTEDHLHIPLSELLAGGDHVQPAAIDAAVRQMGRHLGVPLHQALTITSPTPADLRQSPELAAIIESPDFRASALAAAMAQVRRRSQISG